MSEEGKDKKKYTFKVAFISVVCTLLFIIILLLFVLFGLKKCSSHSSGSSIGNSSSMKYNYDNAKLNDVFKKLVSNQVFVDMGVEDPIDEIVVVTYSDSGSNFTLNIDAKIGDSIYYYFVNDVIYSGHYNFVDYLLTLNLDTNLPLIQGDEYGVSLLPISNERLVNEKSNTYVITNDASSKYLSGYYFENNQYYVYQNKQLSTNDPFSGQPDMVVNLDHPLYGYYQMLNS